MTRHSNPVAYFAWQSFVIFLTGTITMLSLDLAETSDLISAKIEAYARLAVFCLLLGFLLVLAHRKNIAPLIRTIVVFFAFVLIFQLVIGLTDDMRSLDGVALLGIEVVDAANGMRGLELLQEHDFDAVITDLGMSEMHGTDVVSAIKKRDPKIRVIVVSGWSAAEVEQQFRNRPMPDQIIEKPVNVETIRAALRRPRQHLQAN